MKVIAIYGSPRRDGNSDILLNNVIKGIEAKHDNIDIEKIIISNLHISPCTSCGSCMKTGICAIKDDMQHIYPKFVGAQGILVASPIYFMGVSAQLKAFIDRFQSFWSKKYILHLPVREGGKKAEGLFIATAARNDGEPLFAGAVKTIKAFFHIIDTKYTVELLCPGLEEKGAVYKKYDVLEQAFDLGKQFG